MKKRVLLAFILAPVCLFARNSKSFLLTKNDLNIPCEKEVLGTLGQLEIARKWVEVKMAGPASGLRILISKTSSPQVNLEMGVSDSQTQITRSNKNQKIIYLFDKTQKCVPSLRTAFEKSAQNSKVFKDSDLAQIVEANPKGTVVFYTWSPSMNLSVMGLKEIRELSKKQKFKLVPLLDPMTSEISARDTMGKQNLPLEVLRKMDSNILKRDLALIHFPTLIALQDGQLTAVRPGYDKPEVVENYLKSLREKSK